MNLKHRPHALSGKRGRGFFILPIMPCTGFGRILDINCDILGDSVIMKTITETPVVLEIKAGMLNANEFKKAFGKNLEIL